MGHPAFFAGVANTGLTSGSAGSHADSKARPILNRSQPGLKSCPDTTHEFFRCLLSRISLEWSLYLMSDRESQLPSVSSVAPKAGKASPQSLDRPRNYLKYLI